MAKKKTQNFSDTASDAQQEEIIEEVLSYYKDKKLSEEEIPPERHTSDSFSFGFSADDVLSEEIIELNKNSFLNEAVFYLAAVLLAVGAMASAFTMGTSLGAGDDKVSFLTEELRISDEKYNAATAEQKSLNEKLASLTAEHLDTRERAGTIEEYADTKESLEKKLSELSAKAKELNDTLYNKRQTLNAAKESGEKYTITLTPGVYTVGKNLPKGTYSVTGEGSIIASTSAKETKINEQLSADTPASLTLEAGYTIKINKSTTFKLGSQ
ncbi:MAG: hypothetical protein PUF72_10615 [Clostridiales bacterium]|nr:hypothetical protein [Clostridiales bacterium]